MRKIFVVLSVLIFSNHLFAQTETVSGISETFKKDCEELLKEAKKRSSIDTIDNFIKNHPEYVNSEKHYQWLLSIKVQFLEYNNSLAISQLPVNKRFGFYQTQEIIEAYSEAAAACTTCSPNINYRLYKFLDDNGIQDKYQPVNLTRKKFSAKSKYSRRGIGLGFKSMVVDKDIWIGCDLSLRNIFMGPNTIYTYDSLANRWTKKSSTIWSGQGIQLLTIGYAKGRESKQNELTFNLAQLNGPFALKPLQFGKFWYAGGESSWFYRPELGFSFGILYFTAGYNFFFEKENTTSQNKYAISGGASYPIIKHRIKRNRN